MKPRGALAGVSLDRCVRPSHASHFCLTVAVSPTNNHCHYGILLVVSMPCNSSVIILVPGAGRDPLIHTFMLLTVCRRPAYSVQLNHLEN